MLEACRSDKILRCSILDENHQKEDLSFEMEEMEPQTLTKQIVGQHIHLQRSRLLTKPPSATKQIVTRSHHLRRRWRREEDRRARKSRSS
ncbi:hypothetical protein Dsin_014083 [Dipteronia sinensis]|uniref:Uncharacterized protein n=1 Tax=Dipteronia sinensis TaxID=43782 RepID=A0AAE0ALN2_9ROSI|nr:hypothetical protein Dsin_014083 [Dipteronia sinensis]